MKKYTLILIVINLILSKVLFSQSFGFCYIDGCEPNGPYENKYFEVLGISETSPIRCPIIDGSIDSIWNFVTPIRFEKYHNLYNDTSLVQIRWMYDSSNFYALLEVFNDDFISESYDEDGFYFMYQKNFMGIDSGTIENHDGYTEWKYCYWTQDGDRVWKFPSAYSIINGFQSTKVGESIGFNLTLQLSYSLLKDIETNENRTILRANIEEVNGTYNYLWEMAFSWNNWLNWQSLPTPNDTMAIHFTVNDNDNGSGNVTSINLNDPENNSWCTPMTNALITLGQKTIHCTSSAIIDPPTDFKTKNHPEFKVFPNPTSEILNIQLFKNSFSGSIVLTDNLGRQVYSNSLQNQNELKINVGGFEPGLYFVCVTNVKGKNVEKIIIQ